MRVCELQVSYRGGQLSVASGPQIHLPVGELQLEYWLNDPTEARVGVYLCASKPSNHYATLHREWTDRAACIVAAIAGFYKSISTRYFHVTGRLLAKYFQ